MDFKPGEFVRRGHDYQMDSRGGTAVAFTLPCTAEQARAIDEALRIREQDWAARRLVARKFASARDSVTRTLKSWGVSTQDLMDIESGDGPIVATSIERTDAPRTGSGPVGFFRTEFVSNDSAINSTPGCWPV